MTLAKSKFRFFKNLQSGLNGTTPVSLPPSVPNSTQKPVPPPRDHLKIEKDGRIVNITPAPQLPARITTNNNNNNITTTIPPQPVPAAPVVAEPTREQLDSIKKYQVVVYFFL